MRFFKYLIFTFISLFSINSYSALQWIATDAKDNIWSSSADSACRRYALVRFPGSTVSGSLTINIGSPLSTCRIPIKTSAGTLINDLIYLKNQTVPDPECWHPDYKIVSQPVSSQLKKSICVPNNGVMCKYTGNLTNAPIVNGSITTTFSSVSKTPDPDCKEDLVNPPCDPNDPYGGCYTPPNQECTRQFDGSIVCPEDKEPPIEQGCKGADYCKRPPQGCGEGYVSGTWNGERICIKTKPSTGDNTGGSGSDGDGSGSGGDGSGSGGDGSGSGGDGSGSGGDGSGSGGDGSGSGGDGSGSGGIPVTPDLSGVINAIKNIGSKLDHYSKEIIESIDSMSKKITGKLDTSNGHLDQIEANTLATKNNTAQTNDLLQQILDKPQSGDPSTGEGVDLSETNGLLGEIRDGINEIKNVFSDEGKDAIDQLGQTSDDPRYLGALSNADSSLNTFANSLTLSSTACVSDMQIQIPIFGSVNIALSQWCSLLALLKILAHLSVLFACLRMLDSTVRAL